MVTVKYFGAIQTITQIKQEELEAKNIALLLRAIGKKYGREAYRIAKKSHIVVNGENAGLSGGFRKILKEGDTVQILPVCGGG